eukprot:6170801-Alexandrium_andersonii.AAC.1
MPPEIQQLQGLGLTLVDRGQPEPEGLANAPWRLNADRVADAVAQAANSAEAWSNGEEPPAEGPEPDRAA